MTNSPALLDRAAIQARLERIFPEGTPNRGYCVRDIAASTVFTMLYINAVEGTGRYLAPKHVYRMTDRQAGRTDDRSREQYAKQALAPKFAAKGRRWYADNTREPIRDETLREGLIRVGAAIERPGVPTTSSRPRYALTAGFAALFDPQLEDEALDAAIRQWQATNLSAAALARIEIVRRGAAETPGGVLVRFPNQETRRIAAGPSSAIVKAVVEDFAPRYLRQPAVIWLSESQAKVVYRDQDLARRIGLNIDPSRNLPDLILIDLGPREPLLVFVEVVATDGAVTAARRDSLWRIARDAGFAAHQAAFVTAYADRDTIAFRRTAPALAWSSFAWFASEPDKIVVMRDGSQRPAPLEDLLKLM
ncbi:MAG TPA: BsuBI/PstI family type II restriction endonuclease [Candidatus Tectomicrobia bacterium]|nr:BsuBI/PstI family type II restriction endonuclease [Candidatus Tectomicrobia bacterium]